MLTLPAISEFALIGPAGPSRGPRCLSASCTAKLAANAFIAFGDIAKRENKTWYWTSGCTSGAQWLVILHSIIHWHQCVITGVSLWTASRWAKNRNSSSRKGLSSWQERGLGSPSRQPRVKSKEWASLSSTHKEKLCQVLSILICKTWWGGEKHLLSACV